MDEVNDPYFPAFGRWRLSQGSLAAPMVPKFSNENALFANTGIKGTEKTVADLSSILIGQGYHVGDIITFVCISSLVTSVDFDLTNYYDSGNLVQPQWDIRQLNSYQHQTRLQLAIYRHLVRLWVSCRLLMVACSLPGLPIRNTLMLLPSL